VDAVALATARNSLRVVTSGPAQPTVELALAQINPVVGDLVGNADAVIESIRSARASGAQLVLLPELAISGYPPEDLVLRADFLAAARAQLERSAAEANGIVALVGCPLSDGRGGAVNGLAVLAGGELVAVYRKRLLPNYGVFDERRYFTAGQQPLVLDAGGTPVGLTVCEDVWFDHPVCSELAALGARLVLNASASPFETGKSREREAMLRERARQSDMPFAYCNLVGGQDEIVFDGASLVVDAAGEVLARAPQFEEAMLRCSVEVAPPPTRRNPAFVAVELPAGSSTTSVIEPALEPRENEAYTALMTGVRDYIGKNGFPGALIGLSGGLDSALVLALACDALGPERVTAVTMPSPHNSPQTRADAAEMIERLGCPSHELPIDQLMLSFDSALGEAFADLPADQTEENIQARIRGVLLMALSNKHGSLVLTTSNKSETAVGYTTLYGDMAGGFAPLKDVPKQFAFELARWRNARLPAGSLCSCAAPIPASVIERPPSAELRPGQSDEASLGGYDALDRVIELYVEQELGLEEIVGAGVEREYAERVIAMIDRAEYKRRQAPPGVKITRRAFGRERRMPITARRRYA
jgi:NAD+ synthase (glutamine-hydrolysing)